MFHKSLVLWFAATIAALPLIGNAHEYWIEPLAFQAGPDKAIQAHIRVGQKFFGGTYTYIPDNFKRIELHAGDAMAPITGRMGDYPAITADPLAEGLNVIVVASETLDVTYKDYATFEGFVRHKDFAWAIDRHHERGLSEEGIKEAYSRYAKSLVAVGDGAGQDRNFGLLTEIVALANPYTDDLDGTLPVQVFYQGQPRAGAQVEVFEADAHRRVEVIKVHADENGIAQVPVRAGYRYMLDSVVMREPSAELAAERGVVWESLWANLTFAMP